MQQAWLAGMPRFLHSYRMVPMLFVMGTIFLLSHQRGDQLDVVELPFLDKFAHFTVYAVLAATVIFAFSAELKKRRPTLTTVLVVLICTAYGISDEFHQSFIPGRYASAGDVLADMIGAASIALYWLYRKMVKDPDY